jgi:hypothetical protein
MLEKLSVRNTDVTKLVVVHSSRSVNIFPAGDPQLDVSEKKKSLAVKIAGLFFCGAPLRRVKLSMVQRRYF